MGQPKAGLQSPVRGKKAVIKTKPLAACNVYKVQAHQTVSMLLQWSACATYLRKTDVACVQEGLRGSEGGEEKEEGGGRGGRKRGKEEGEGRGERGQGKAGRGIRREERGGRRGGGGQGKAGQVRALALMCLR